MDKAISGYYGLPDDDLMVCMDRGVAYQRDMTKLVEYDGGYYNKCLGYEDKEIALKINQGRIDLVNKYLRKIPFTPAEPVLDVGVGSGEFIKKRPHTYGYDINPKAVEWLKSCGLYADDFSRFWAFTFWDVIEHVPEPDSYFRFIPDGALLFTSIPIFDDLSRIRESRHYRPGEHLYYWTQRGFIEWMESYRFRLREIQRFEIDAGRENIYTFAFKRAYELKAAA